ncbi:hypothetical protein BURPS1710b_A1375 [Burkholderia pseudomallei 1710b]|uniref:Uncharacterized protein n=3 Tax=pseudomallei group TaxID=111527 RepID=Q3JIS2_BURP1|nr:hypothetical protein BURPS1710b_A1375 [Burkholderia pseudomallei 1710b]
MFWPPASTPPMTPSGDACSLINAIFCMTMAPVPAGANVPFAAGVRNAHARLPRARGCANAAAKVTTACRKARRRARRARQHTTRRPARRGRRTVARRLRRFDAPGRRADSTKGAHDEGNAIPRAAIHAAAFAPSCREALRPPRHGRADRARGRVPRAAAGGRRGGRRHGRRRGRDGRRKRQRERQRERPERHDGREHREPRDRYERRVVVAFDERGHEAARHRDHDQGEGRAARDERSVVRRHPREDAARRGAARGHGARRAAAHARRRRDQAGGRREDRARQADGAAQVAGPFGKESSHEMHAEADRRADDRDHRRDERHRARHRAQGREEGREARARRAQRYRARGAVRGDPPARRPRRRGRGRREPLRGRPARGGEGRRDVRRLRHVDQQRGRDDLRLRAVGAARRPAPAVRYELLGRRAWLARRVRAFSPQERLSRRRDHQHGQRGVRRAGAAAKRVCGIQARDQGLHRFAAHRARGGQRAGVGHARQARGRRHDVRDAREELHERRGEAAAADLRSGHRRRRDPVRGRACPSHAVCRRRGEARVVGRVSRAAAVRPARHVAVLARAAHDAPRAAARRQRAVRADAPVARARRDGRRGAALVRVQHGDAAAESRRRARADGRGARRRGARARSARRRFVARAARCARTARDAAMRIRAARAAWRAAVRFLRCGCARRGLPPRRRSASSEGGCQ